MMRETMKMSIRFVVTNGYLRGKPRFYRVWDVKAKWFADTPVRSRKAEAERDAKALNEGDMQ
jgi:hypothetical protein